MIVICEITLLINKAIALIIGCEKMHIMMREGIAELLRQSSGAVPVNSCLRKEEEGYE